MNASRIPYKFTVKEPSGNILEFIRLESGTEGIKGEILECRQLTNKEMEDDIIATRERIAKFMKDKGFNGNQRNDENK